MKAWRIEGELKKGRIQRGKGERGGTLGKGEGDVVERNTYEYKEKNTK